jgi:hypothetical protein
MGEAKMNEVVIGLAPVLVASFGLQQFIDLLDPLLEHLAGRHKVWLLSLLTLLTALTLTFLLGLRALEPVGYAGPDWADGLLTALMLTGGTRWLGDLLKLLSYKKDELRARTARLSG